MEKSHGRKFEEKQIMESWNKLEKPDAVQEKNTKMKSKRYLPIKNTVDKRANRISLDEENLKLKLRFLSLSEQEFRNEYNNNNNGI